LTRANTAIQDAERQDEVTVDGVRVHYLRLGHGTPLLLLHGFTVGSSRLTYGPSLEPLSQHFDVIAPDLPGYGLSDVPEKLFTTADYVRFVVRFMDALELNQVNLVGFSKGGAIALGIGLEHPERVHKLMLVSAYALNSWVTLPFLPYFALRTPWLVRFFWRSLRRYRRLLPLYLKRVIFGNAGAVTEQLLAEVREPLAKEGSEAAFIAWLRGELGMFHYATDYSRRIRELRVPTLFLHGTRDLVVPVQGARRAAKLAPDASLRLVRRCGHWLPREATGAFVDAVTMFFAKA
jgi:pimeloyl-ACP methyl ester carboxylesterase